MSPTIFDFDFDVDASRGFHALNALFESLSAAVLPHSCDIVVLHGRLDRERLRSAIRATLSRHPVLCRPLAARHPAAEAERQSSELPLDLRFHHLDHDDPPRVDAHLLGLIWDEPLPPDGRPVRFHVTETPTRTYLQTLHTHVYADATACYLLTEQIAASYGGHRSRDVTRVEAQAPPHPGKEPRSAGLSLRERLAYRARGLALTLRDLAADQGGLALPRRKVAGRRRLSSFVLSPEETDQLRAAARGRGHSIHGFFQLAFLRAATEYNARRAVSRPVVRLWDFFSLRPILPGASARYDCLALIYPVELDARWSDAESLAHCTRVVERMRGGELLEHAYRFDALFRRLGGAGVAPRRGLMRLWPSIFKSNVFVTNPGVCPSRLPTFGSTEVIDYVTFPQLFFPADVMFVFSTFRDELRILVVYDEDAFGASFHDELLAPFLRKLGALAGLDLSAAKTEDGFVARWTSTPRDGRRTRSAPMKWSA